MSERAERRLAEDFKTVIVCRCLLVALLVVVAGCSRGDAAKAPIEPVYDKTTGRLTLLKYDADHDGRTDTWSYMDGARVLYIEIDTDHDGRADKWEYYDDKAQLDRVSYGAGEKDHPSRVEHYVNGALTRSEEDADRDGRIDKWDTYEGGRLAIVAFDTAHRGSPDRRLVYGADGTVRAEVDPDGDGKFTPSK